MKAAQINEYGDASKIHVNEVDKPAAGEGQVLVEVHASSLNPFDSKLRDGVMQNIPLKFPATLGGDIAGVVVEVGPGASDFAVGDKVYGQAAAVAGNSGAFAEYAATKAGQIAKAPTNLDFTEAASLPLVGVSAVQALIEHINLQAGQRILIHGGSGGIGSIAIQIAKHLGAHVATTAPGEAIDFVKKLGADEAIDFKTQDFTTLVHDYDAVFDTVGGDVFEKSLGVLKPGGVAVSMIAHVEDAVAQQRGVTAISQGTKVTTEKLEKLAKLVEDGVVTPQIAKVFPLGQIQEAFKFRETQTFTGKVVLQIS